MQNNSMQNNSIYKLEKIISSGSFGCVYLGSCGNKKYAIKKDNSDLLKNEIKIYKHLRSVKNIPIIYDYIQKDNIKYIVMELMNIDLIKYKDIIFNTDLHIDKCLDLFIHLINIISVIHDYGIVHRDLKPKNICFNNYYEPYIIDFGLAKPIIHNNKHIEEKTINAIIGSNNFSSINVINLIEPSRRDDVESIMYIFLYVLLDSENYLYYSNMDTIYKKDIDVISSLVYNYSEYDSKKIENVLKYIRKLKFNQRPNYSYIISLM